MDPVEAALQERRGCCSYRTECAAVVEHSRAVRRENWVGTDTFRTEETVAAGAPVAYQKRQGDGPLEVEVACLASHHRRTHPEAFHTSYAVGMDAGVVAVVAVHHYHLRLLLVCSRLGRDYYHSVLSILASWEMGPLPVVSVGAMDSGTIPWQFHTAPVMGPDDDMY